MVNQSDDYGILQELNFDQKSRNLGSKQGTKTQPTRDEKYIVSLISRAIRATRKSVLTCIFSFVGMKLFHQWACQEGHAYYYYANMKKYCLNWAEFVQRPTFFEQRNQARAGPILENINEKSEFEISNFLKVT